MTSAERMAQYEDLFNKSQAYDPNRFQNEFEKGYGEATNNNQDLIQRQADSMANLQAVAPDLRQKYSQSFIKDPTLQRSLIAQARQNPISEYGTAAGLLEQRGGRYQDILGKQLQAYLADQQNAQTAAENAWRLYQDAKASEEAARSRAASSSGGDYWQKIIDILNNDKNNEATDSEKVYEIPGGGNKIVLGDSFQDRLTQRVLDQRGAQGFGDILKSYTQTSLEPFRNLKTIGDVASIPTRGYAASTVTLSDLFNRIFKR